MAFVNSLDWNQLQPIFVCGADSNVLDDKVFISNGGSTITAANGNLDTHGDILGFIWQIRALLASRPQMMGITPLRMLTVYVL